jgi:apolipoprotein N-acyltransferase
MSKPSTRRQKSPANKNGQNKPEPVKKGFSFKSFLMNFAAVLLASVLFAASFPNLLFENGLPLLAWVAYVPVFWLIRRVSLGASVLWGALYGYAAYGLFNYWLSVFHPLAGLIVGTIYMVYLAILFPLLKAASLLFPRRAYLVQWLLWMGYEYLRTLGFLGYAYGITGYTQWSMITLIQIASIFGVWGVSALVVFPSAAIGNGLHGGSEEGLLALASRAGAVAGAGAGSTGGGIRGLVTRKLASLRGFVKRERVAVTVWSLALVATLVYGVVSPVDYSDAPTARLALIQDSTDPWRGGFEQYRRNFATLRSLSLEALAEDPKPDMVVWSETAFVPRIHWHLTYQEDPAYLALVRSLMGFLSQQDVPFVIGNDDARKVPGPDGTLQRVDYNAAMLFEKGQQTGVYRKLHLVPFTEHFPYEKQLPAIHQALKDADTHFWEKGKEATVFDVKGIKFSTPICFEDTFGYLSRIFVRNGAELIVNMTNDAWANSLPSQMQHLGMAVFRAVENRRTVARATASGQTCAIDPNGRIIDMAEPFKATRLTVEVPLMTASTIYTAFGDFLGQGFLIGALLVLPAGVVARVAGKRKRSQS